jgi:hypothetical protein|eukprot:COSAG01_NODE_8120_length_2914_cov_2.256838_4_plen_65_part_00
MTIQTVGSPAKIHPSLARAWLTADDPETQTFLGGRWSADSLYDEIAQLRKERDEAKRAAAAAKL